MRSLFTIALVCLMAAPALADDSSLDAKDVLSFLKDNHTLPEEWEGVWDVSQEQRDCDDNVQDTTTDVLQLCAGDEPPTGDTGDIACTGSATSTTITMDCSGSQQIFAGCNLVTTIDIDGTRSGDTATITSIINSTAVGTALGCSAIPDTCIKVVTTMTRTSEEPDCTGVSTDQQSWGTVKARFQ